MCSVMAQARCIRDLGERNELLVQVSKQSERAQLLVYIYFMYNRKHMVYYAHPGQTGNPDFHTKFPTDRMCTACLLYLYTYSACTYNDWDHGSAHTGQKLVGFNHLSGLLTTTQSILPSLSV